MKKEFYFIKALAGTSEKGYKYNFIVVSDGLQAGNLSNPNGIDFSSYKEGDKVTLEIGVKPNGKGFDVVLAGLVASK